MYLVCKEFLGLLPKPLDHRILLIVIRYEVNVFLRGLKDAKIGWR
jgi:hypothetical protein